MPIILVNNGGILYIIYCMKIEVILVPIMCLAVRRSHVRKVQFKEGEKDRLKLANIKLANVPFSDFLVSIFVLS